MTTWLHPGKAHWHRCELGFKLLFSSPRSALATSTGISLFETSSLCFANKCRSKCVPKNGHCGHCCLLLWLLLEENAGASTSSSSTSSGTAGKVDAAGTDGCPSGTGNMAGAADAAVDAVADTASLGEAAVDTVADAPGAGVAGAVPPNHVYTSSSIDRITSATSGASISSFISILLAFAVALMYFILSIQCCSKNVLFNLFAAVAVVNTCKFKLK